jgi:hypothetical protein
MVTAIRQHVTIGPGGVVEVRSPDLTAGEQADVIVLVKRSGGMDPPVSPAASVELLKSIQRDLNLRPESATAWIEQTQDERRASSVKRESDE